MTRGNKSWWEVVIAETTLCRGVLVASGSFNIEFTSTIFRMGASKRPCVFEVFGVGWGGVGGCNNVHVSCVQGDATWMLRWRYVDHTLMLRWGDVDATVGVGWGGVGGDVITFMSLVCKVLRRGCYVDVTLIMRWLYVDLALLIRWCYFDHAPLLRWCYVDYTLMLRFNMVLIYSILFNIM